MLTREETALLENPSAFKEGLQGDLDLNLNTPAKYALRGEVINCPERWIIITCSCRPHLVRSGCMNRNCERCFDRVKARAGARAENRLTHNRGWFDPILKTIFTVPPHLYEKMSNRKVWRSTLRKVVAMLKADFGFKFGIEASHPTGEALDVFKPHANFLWRQKPGFRASLNLTKLREKWRDILGLHKDAKLANPHHEFIIPNSEEAKNKLAHACAYTLRPFPGWSHWTGSVRWYGSYPRGIKQKQTDAPCLTCGENFKYMGVATDEEVEMWKLREWEFRLLYPPDVGRSPPEKWRRFYAGENDNKAVV